MDYILRNSLTLEDAYTVRRRMSVRRTGVKIPALAYADDAALISADPDVAQRQRHRFEAATAKVHEGLRLNASKTKFMYIGDIPYTTICKTAGAPLAACVESTFATRDAYCR